MKNFKLFTEGTWAIPDTPAKEKELIKIFKKPLPASKSTKVLYNLIGDDGLYDLISRVEKEDGRDADVRGVVKFWIASRTFGDAKKQKAMQKLASKLDE
jgi:hypothetical protein